MYILWVSLMCPVGNIITKEKLEFLFWFGRFGGNRVWPLCGGRGADCRNSGTATKVCHTCSAHCM